MGGRSEGGTEKSNYSLVDKRSDDEMIAVERKQEMARRVQVRGM